MGRFSFSSCSVDITGSERKSPKSEENPLLTKVEQVSSLEDLPFIPVPVAAQNFSCPLIFSPGDNGFQDKLGDCISRMDANSNKNLTGLLITLYPQLK